MKDMKKQTCDMGGFSLMWFMFLMSKFSPPSNPVNPSKIDFRQNFRAMVRQRRRKAPATWSGYSSIRMSSSAGTIQRPR